MARVRLLMAMSGRDHSWSVGDAYECDDVSAARLVAEGRAEWFAPPVVAAPETTMQAGPPERAVRPRGRPRG